MASSYSTDLKLELMVTGENAGTWGDNTNNNLNLIQQAIAGYEAVALSDGGTVTLAMTDKTISNARNMVIKFTGTLTSASIVTIPDSIEKFYIFDCSAVVGPTNLTIKTASGTGFTLDRAAIYAAYADGTNLNEISLDTLGGKVAAAQLTPAGSDKQIQFNDNGSFGAIAIGTCGQVLTSDGTSASFQDPAGGGAVSWNTTAITADPNPAVAGTGYFVNTTSGAVTVTLPSSPSAGDIVAVSDYAQTSTTNAITIGRNGENIQGSAADLTINKNGAAITLIYVDATKGWIVINSGNEDDAIGPRYVAATGGCVSCCGDYKIHTFTGPGTFCVTCAGNACGSNTVDYLVVAGGGGGSSSVAGGGGGGGGLRFSSGTFCVPNCAPASPLNSAVDLSIPVSAGPNPVTVGGGGPGSPGNAPGANSVFSTITSAGGGSNPADGGSGGGRAHRGGAGGTGNTPPTTPPQGQDGGASPFNTYSGGGGGGATQAGQAAQPPMPQGPGGFGGAGAGLPNAFGTSGVPCGSFYYFSGGGGGGGMPPGTGGTGGIGGGANGGSNPGTGGAGTTNTGGGGGGNGGAGGNSGAGGSGIVIIRYKYQ